MLIQLLRLPSDNQEENLIPVPEERLHKALAAVLTAALSKTGFTAKLAELAIDPWVSLWLLDDEALRDLNASRRQVDRATDVLSFPAAELQDGRWPEDPSLVFQTEPPLGFSLADFDDEGDDEEGSDTSDRIASEEEDANDDLYSWEMGTIAISVSRAAEQAEAYGHHVLRELCFLAVHGMLHLLGYDHEGEGAEADESRQRMEELQEEILTEAGITRDLTDDHIMGTDFAGMLNGTDTVIEADTVLAAEWDELLSDDNPFESLIIEADPEDEEPLPEGFVSGFISLLGRTNAGKSTLLNALTGLKVAITSHKSQTTRNNIRAIINQDDAQLIFTDTPGIFRAGSKLNEFMRESALRALQDADIGVLLVDSEKANITGIERAVCEEAQKLGKPLILLLTKIDLIAKENLLPAIARYSELYPFEAIIPISALKDDGLLELITAIKRVLPEGPRYYPRESSTDQTERSLAGELIREQVLYYLHQEIPHGIAVQVEAFEELGRDEIPVNNPDDRTLVRITASILCERESHKRIVIGKDGQSLKRIGSSARRAIEQMLGVQVFLDLHVKVRENWQNRSDLLKDLGYSGDSRSGRGSDIL